MIIGLVRPLTLPGDARDALAVLLEASIALRLLKRAEDTSLEGHMAMCKRVRKNQNVLKNKQKSLMGDGVLEKRTCIYHRGSPYMLFPSS